MILLARHERSASTAFAELTTQTGCKSYKITRRESVGNTPMRSSKCESLPETQGLVANRPMKLVGTNETGTARALYQFRNEQFIPVNSRGRSFDLNRDDVFSCRPEGDGPRSANDPHHLSCLLRPGRYPQRPGLSPSLAAMQFLNWPHAVDTVRRKLV